MFQLRPALIATASMVSVATLYGCSTTKPLDGAAIDYHLPRTDAVAHLSLTLVECGATDFKVDGELAITASPGAQAKTIHIDGANLASSRIKRDLHITVSEEGVITGVNSSNADQTPAIIGAAVKIAATAAAAALVAHAPPPGIKPPLDLCSTQIKTAVQRVGVLKKQIDFLHTELAGAPGEHAPSPADLARIRQINILSREFASLRTGPLHVDTTGKLNLEEATQKPMPLELDPEPFAKWFGKEAKKEVIEHYFKLTWTATPETTPLIDTPAPSHPKKHLRECGFSIPVPQVVSAKVVVEAAKGSNLDSLKADQTLAVAQWAQAARLCLDVGFGESRTVALTFDKFGRRSDFQWSTEATGATVATALAGSAEDLSSLATTIRGPSKLDRQKARIDELETQQKLNGLLACQAIIDAGGFDCGQDSGGN